MLSSIHHGDAKVDTDSDAKMSSCPAHTGNSKLIELYMAIEIPPFDL